MNDLIEFLKSLVLNTILIDKKYRETVPEIVSKLKTSVEDSDDGESKSKKRKPKKVKIGKDGLYPLEESHVRRWWKSNKPNISDIEDPSTSPEEVKYHISCLRRRETQLQMILILEILALEPLSRVTEATEESQLPGVESQRTPKAALSGPPPKKRNKHNFPVLLDVNADRLCIWQSTTSDEIRALAESQTTNQQQQAERTDRMNSDPLKDFCVDVILPL
jgi:DNA replication regulator SLD3